MCREGRALFRAGFQGCRATDTRGFTLIELLVVVAVIGILASLLLPGMARAKDGANRIVCLSNVHQLMLAWLLYENDTGRLSPTAGGPYSGDVTNPGWTAGWMGWQGGPDIASMRTNLDLLMGPGAGKIGPYLKSAGVFRCPADRSGMVKDRERAPFRVRSYSMNVAIGSPATWDPEVQVSFYKMADFRRVSPAGIWIFLEEHSHTIDDGRFDLMWPASEGGENWSSFPSTRHGRAGPVSFADGHVEVRKWVEASTRPDPKVLGTQMVFLVPGSRDFRWLHDRTRVYGDHGPQ